MRDLGSSPVIRNGALCWSTRERPFALFLKNHPIGVENIFFQLLKGCPLTEHARNLRQTAYKPVTVLPIFKSESN
jgi:hypothetical protein